jgi:hypothetical protein
MKIHHLLFTLVFTCLLFSGFDIPENFDYGHLQKNTYVNSFFNFRINIPDSWSVQNKEQLVAVMEKGKDMMARDNNQLKNAMKAASVNVANLLAVTQFERGAPSNPSMIINAENLKDFPGIKTGGDYLSNARKLILKSAIQYSNIDEDFKKMKLGGMDAYSMDMKIENLGPVFNQRIYCMLINGFSLNICITWQTEEQEQILLNSIESIRFGV